MWENPMKVKWAICAITAAVMLTGCAAQVVPAPEESRSTRPDATTPSPHAGTQASGQVAGQTTGPFPRGSATCNDSVTDSNPLNITTSSLMSDGKTLSVVVTLDSLYPIQHGREFQVTMGRVQHQTDYIVSIKENATRGVTVSVSDERAGHTTQVPTNRASITDEKVTAEIPASSLPRLGDHFVWKVEALANGFGYDICPNENSSGVRIWLDFPGRG
ncbi:hypothetical protein [Arthrobacter woluwensis]|uniref:hypothetical protein n=1 Tax=Arthrobacter woluwensis TaxID=156980 RepID=UPI00380B6603